MLNIETHNAPYVLLLAAGVSARMGDKNKLLLPHEGQPLITHSAAFFSAHFSRVFIVTGFEADKLKAACAGLDVSFIHNPDYEAGLGSSFAAGLRGLPDIESPLYVALADQIFIGADDLKALQAAYIETDQRRVIIPQYNGRRGHPVIFPPKTLAVMRSAKPIMTGRKFIEAYPRDCHFIAMADAHCVLDIDTPEDVRQHLRPNETCHDRS